MRVIFYFLMVGGLGLLLVAALTYQEHQPLTTVLIGLCSAIVLFFAWMVALNGVRGGPLDD